MVQAFHLKTDVAEPLQEQARRLRPLATSSQTIAAYNQMCDRLDEMQTQLSKSASGGLVKDWQKIV